MVAACNQHTCLFCGGCVAICPVDCITVYENRWDVSETCTDCGLCAKICPVGSLYVPAKGKRAAVGVVPPPGTEIPRTEAENVHGHLRMLPDGRIVVEGEAS